MVAGRDHIDAAVKKMLRAVRRDSIAFGRILAICDDNTRIICTAQTRQLTPQFVAAGLSDHIPEKKYVHVSS